jgi:hypothetical protein
MTLLRKNDVRCGEKMISNKMNVKGKNRMKWKSSVKLLEINMDICLPRRAIFRKHLQHAQNKQLIIIHL